MYARNVCRLCLSTDTPVRDIADSSLQDVYEKLTEISLNTPLRLVAACYVCYSRLRKCHNLMMSAVRADKVLTHILQSGAGSEQEFLAAIKRYQLSDGLRVTPTKLFTITGTEHSLIKHVIKEEPPLSQSNEEVEADMQTLVKHFKLEESAHEESIARTALEDMDDIESEELINKGVKLEMLEGKMDIDEHEVMVEVHVNFKLEEMQDISSNELIHEENTEEKMLQGPHPELIDGVKLKGAAPAEECKEKQVYKTQDGRTTKSEGNNVIDNPRMCRAVMQEEARNKNINVSSYTLQSIKKSAKNRQVSINTSMYSDSVINKTNVSVNSDRDCASTNPDVGNNNSKQLKMFVCKNRSGMLSEKPFECDICKHRFKRRSNLRAHLTTHTGQKPFECEICKVKFRLKDHLRTHLMTHTGQKPFECEICKVRFSHKNTLKYHLMTHTGHKPFECEICKVRFRMKGHLRRHSFTHTRQNPFECDICKVRFSFKDSLKRHLITHTGQKPFECDICKVRFRLKHHLKTHSMKHTGQKPFECKICEVGFIQKSSLKTHLMTHTGQNPFECEICKVGFSQKSLLKSHSRIHTGHKPFECEICKVRFSYKNTLKYHLMTHTGQKPIECEICNIRFATTVNLNRHLRTHTGERPFECDICRVRFTDKGNLKRHSITHTDQKPFECDICKVRFRRKCHLKAHLKTHTGQKSFK